MTGLVMTKTKTQRGLVEPVTQIKKPWSIQAEMGEEWDVKETGLGGKRSGFWCGGAVPSSKTRGAVVGRPALGHHCA